MGHTLDSRQACNSPASLCAHGQLGQIAEGLAFVGHSAAIERLRLQVRRVAPHLRIALITGERGTGKQQIARTLHTLSGKDAAAFHMIQTASELPAPPTSQGSSQINKRRPTYYLPNLSTLTPRHQAELLAAIHSIEAALPASRRPQLIFATTDDLRGLVAAGQFHPDLFRTISSVEITLPPLRSRPEDLSEIVSALLAKSSGTHPHPATAPRSLLDSRALSRLRGYGWPGNLRELAHVVALARHHAGSGAIEAMHLPPLEATAARPSYAAAGTDAEAETERLDEIIERHVLNVLVRCSGNKVRAAERLGISRSTLYRMLEASPSASSLHHAHTGANGQPQSIASARPMLHQ